MTTTQLPSSALLALLSRTNEAIAGHEAGPGTNGSALDVAEAAHELVKYLHANAATVVAALGPFACKPALRAMVRANEAATEYANCWAGRALVMVHQRHAVITTATALVQVLMDDIDAIMEAMDA